MNTRLFRGKTKKTAVEYYKGISITPSNSSYMKGRGSVVSCVRNSIRWTLRVCILNTTKRNMTKSPHTSARDGSPRETRWSIKQLQLFPKKQPLPTAVSTPLTSMACVPSPLTRRAPINRRLSISSAHSSPAAPRTSISHPQSTRANNKTKWVPASSTRPISLSLPSLPWPRENRPTNWER